MLITGMAVSSMARAELISYWNFNGNLQDSVGGNHGTPVGGVATGLDNGRTALVLDGVDDYITVPAGMTSTLDMTTNSFTVSAWLRWDDVDATNDRDFVFSHHGNGGLHNGYSMDLRSGTQAASGSAFFTIDSGAVGVLTGTHQSLTDSVWHHMAVVVDRGTQTSTMYIDGVVASSGTAPHLNPRDISTALNASTIDATGSVFHIGANWNSTPSMGAQNFRGSIDDFAIWTDALPQTSISGLANGTLTPLTAPIPEPGTLLFVGIALVVCGKRLRRKEIV
jgi:hypothetical protein